MQAPVYYLRKDFNQDIQINKILALNPSHGYYNYGKLYG